MTRERQPQTESPIAPKQAAPSSQHSLVQPTQTPRLPLRFPSPAQLELSRQRRAAQLQELARGEAKRQLEVTARSSSQLESRGVTQAEPMQALTQQSAVPGDTTALESRPRVDDPTRASSAPLPAEERQARLEAQQRAFEVSQRLETQPLEAQSPELQPLETQPLETPLSAQPTDPVERERRMNSANRQAVAFGTGQTSSANGLGGVISALPVEERLEVFAGIRDQHPTTWAKLESLPLVRWDEEWQARVAEQRMQLQPGGLSSPASLEVTAGEGQIVQSPLEQSASSSSASAAQRLKRLYDLIRRGGLDGTQLREVTELADWLIRGNRLLGALDGLEIADPQSNRSIVLETLLNSVYTTGLRNTITVQALGGLEQITFDGFVEQLSSFMAYSNTLDFSDLNNPRDAKGGAAKILQSFGYKATPAIHGAWGLQMMIFTPVEGKAKYAQGILAFRGTQGVKMPSTPAVNAASSRGNPNAFRKDNESELDTATDFSEADIAYTQFDTNRELIADTVNHATRTGSAVVSGHSLGGALAQITAARFPRFGQLLTFQAPHVKGEDLERLEAQPKLRSVNYRMNLDAVPRGGPQNKMAGEIAVFEDQNTALNAPFGSHHTPMLAELLEQTRAEGGRLTPQQAVLVDNGKQPPNELSHPSGNANTVRLQQLIPGTADQTVVAQGSAGFGSQNENVVANNLLVNVMRELLLPDLEKLTTADIRKNGGNDRLLRELNRLRGDIRKPTTLDQARARPFSTESRTILEAYGKSAEVFALDVDIIRRNLNFAPSQPAGPRKLLEIALWWKTGQNLESVNNILDATRRMTSQDLGRWWYSANLDGEDLYRALVTRTAGSDQPYL